MPTTTTDLTTCSDLELDHVLHDLYQQHRAADPDDRLAIHLAVIDVLAEQSIRLEGWLHAQAQPTDASAPATA